jgi:hypothetical protein
MTDLTNRSIDAAIAHIDAQRQTAISAADDLHEMCIDADGHIDAAMWDAMLPTMNALDSVAAIYEAAYAAAIDEGNAQKATES